jgi:ParB family chromosome partitioning protein
MSKAKSRLGRGLSSLITVREEIPAARAMPAASAAAPPAPLTDSSEIEALQGSLTIPVNKVIPNPHQPRRSFSDASLQELAGSLKANGLIQPILVRKEGDRFELIAGERRWRAAKLAGLAEIPAIVRDVDGLTQAQLALVENIQREDLNPIDRALAYRNLMNQLGLTQAELAGRLGEERSNIANFVRLLDLADGPKELLATGKLSLGHGKVLAGISDPAEQSRLAELSVSQGLSVRNLERLVQNPTIPATREAKPASAHITDLEKNIARQIGLKVQIRSKGAKGRITLHYASLDQFDELMSRMGVAVE